MPTHSIVKGLVAAMAISLAVLGARADDEPELVVKTRARLKELQKELEGMREARFESPVAIKAQSQEGCKKAFQAGLESWLPRARSKLVSRAYGKLGLLPKGYDLLAGMEELYATQVFAYYQPGEGTFYVVESGLPGIAVDSIMLHELAHALDDQRFGLGTIYALGAGKEDDDIGLAGQFLIEGTAYYISILSQARARDEVGKLDELAEAEGRLDRDALEAEYARRLIGYAEGKSLYEETARRRARLPLYVWRRYMEPYTKGCLMVSRVKRAGGWKAVDALWRRPPTSTEQVLHPEKLLEEDRDEPVAVRPGDVAAELGEGWKRTTTNVLGELGMQTVLENRGLADVAAVASGWGGDRFDAYEKDEQRTALVWLTAWDTEAAARNFEEKFPRRDDSVLVRRERDVVVVEGALQAGKKVAAAALERATVVRTR
jgi:hypothetical protein